MVSWSVAAPALVNAKGDKITLTVLVIATNGEIPSNIAPSDMEFDTSKVREVFGWRFDSSNRELFLATTPKQLEIRLDGIRAGEFKFEEDVPNPGQDTLTMKVTLHLDLTREIAINAESDSGNLPHITVLETGWMTINTGSGPLLASEIQDIALDTDLIGGIPTSDLKMRVDAHAESVDRVGDATDPLNLWTALWGGNNLTNAADNGPALSSGDGAVPTVTFNNSSTEEAMKSPTTFAQITTAGTFAVAFKPVGSQATSVAQLMGRFQNAGRSWRLYYDDTADPLEVVYQTFYSSTNTYLHMKIDEHIEPDEDSIIAIFTRNTSVGWQAWINGIPAATTGSLAASVLDGNGSFTVGARDTGGGDWGDLFKGEINQAIAYNTERPPFNLALIAHQMALLTGVDLGAPLDSEEYDKPPYLDPEKAPAALLLDRKPIARINCYGARFDENIFGQNAGWRPNPMSQTAVEAFLRQAIREILNACDDFEIMFNRPGGTYFDDIVPTYIWGSGVDPQTQDPILQVTDEQWGALINIFDEFGLDDHNDRGLGVARSERKRRAWFYTGFGLPLKQSAGDIGDLETDGHMYDRVVGPLTASSYKTILDNWVDLTDNDPPRGDPRFRCLHCDAASLVYGLFTRLCNDSVIYENFLLVGESITTDAEARRGAVWYGSLEFGRAPWWNEDPDPPHERSKNFGYDTQWSTNWDVEPIYFGVESGAYPYLHDAGDPPTPAGDGANMTMEDIYRFILKGGTPVAVSPQSRRKVGAAWNYAMKRIPMTPWDRSGRLCRVQR